MKLPERIGYKIYFVIFAWLCFGELAALFIQEADPYIYYHTLAAIHSQSSTFYMLAIARTGINMACLIPLFIYAFNKKNDWKSFFKLLLVIRIIMDVTGHNYEWQSVKSLFHAGPLLPLFVMGIWIGISYLSYKAHVKCAFPGRIFLLKNPG